MLHHQEKENVEVNPVNINFRAIAEAERKELLHLQEQRSKANKQRKPYWQKRIDQHFGM